MRMKKKGQIWVETVIYTLIGLALIGVVLAIVTPKINQSKDKIIVEQSIGSLNVFDEKIMEVIDNGVGNRRIIRELNLKKGELVIDGKGDEITLTLEDMSRPYSEPGVSIEIGNVIVLSEASGKKAIVKLALNYSGEINLTFSGKDDAKKFDPAAIPYSFSIDNKEGGRENLFVIDILETSGRRNEPNNPAPQPCTPSAEICNDLGDNDCDGLVDCDDFTCNSDPVCQEEMQCEEGHTNNQDGTCTATLGEDFLIEDGEIFRSSDGTIGKNADGEFIRIGYNIENSRGYGYSEWNISSIPGSSNILDVQFKYQGFAYLSTDDSFRKQQIISIDSSPKNTQNEELFRKIDGVDVSIYFGQDSNFIESGIQGPFSLSSLASATLEDNLNVDWFAVGFRPTVNYNSVPNISSSEGSFAPTLVVKYAPA